jgi:hypothetical protein
LIGYVVSACGDDTISEVVVDSRGAVLARVIVVGNELQPQIPGVIRIVSEHLDKARYVSLHAFDAGFHGPRSIDDEHDIGGSSG